MVTRMKKENAAYEGEARGLLTFRTLAKNIAKYEEDQQKSVRYKMSRVAVMQYSGCKFKIPFRRNIWLKKPNFFSPP